MTHLPLLQIRSARGKTSTSERAISPRREFLIRHENGAANENEFALHWQTIFRPLVKTIHLRLEEFAETSLETPRAF